MDATDGVNIEAIVFVYIYYVSIQCPSPPFSFWLMNLPQTAFVSSWQLSRACGHEDVDCDCLYERISCCNQESHIHTVSQVYKVIVHVVSSVQNDGNVSCIRARCK